MHGLTYFGVDFHYVKYRSERTPRHYYSWTVQLRLLAKLVQYSFWELNVRKTELRNERAFVRPHQLNFIC